MRGTAFETLRAQPLAAPAVDQTMEILKPFVLLACAAFTVGFVGYWALVGAVAPGQGPAPGGGTSEIASPAAPDLASARHI